MKPFNFEEFKAGKPAVIRDKVFHFLAYDEALLCPLVVKYEQWVKVYALKYFTDNATMLPSKRTVWIAICEDKNGHVWTNSHFASNKEEALDIFKGSDYWKVIDAIPYEIEE